MRGAVTYDGDYSSTSHAAPGGGAAIKSFTVPPGSNQVLVVVINYESGATTGNTVTYNGTAMTLLRSDTAGTNNQLFVYYLANPATGAAHDISVNPNPDYYTGSIGISAFSYSGVDTAAPLGAQSATTGAVAGPPYALSNAITPLNAGSTLVQLANVHTGGCNPDSVALSSGALRGSRYYTLTNRHSEAFGDWSPGLAGVPQSWSASFGGGCAQTGSMVMLSFELLPSTPPTATPSFTPTPFPVPGCLEVEDYSAAYDSTAGNAGGAYRAGDVDIEPCGDAGGGYDVGWSADGEWLEYGINVAATGSYDFTLRTASAAGVPGSVEFFLDGVSLGPATALPFTGGWQTWTSTLIPGLNLSAGGHTLRMLIVTGGSNFNSICAAPHATPTPSPSPTFTPTPALTTAACASGLSVDGSLGEAAWAAASWNSLGVSSVGAPGPLSARFKVLWNSGYLYLGVDVDDPTLFVDSPDPWEDDSVEIYIDRNHAHSASYQADDEQIIVRRDASGGFRVSNGHSTVGMLVGAVAKGGGTGYVLELAIPWSAFGSTPVDGTVIGFDLAVNSDTDGGVRDGQMIWTGDWTAFNNPSVFGDLVLGGPCVSPTPSPTAMACSTPQCTGSWSVIGGGSVIAPGHIQLTSDTMWQTTAMWSNFKLDLSQSWSISYNLYFGTKDVDGADGIVFVMHDDPRGLAAIGDAGQGLSYAGVAGPNGPITPSVDIEWDTWKNDGSGDPLDFNDPGADNSADYTSIHLNGNGDEASAVAGGAVLASSTQPDIEDGARHQVTITWNRASNTLTSYFDGAMRQSYSNDLVANVFGGKTCVYWGFTSGTGGNSNLQQVQELSCITPTFTPSSSSTATPTSTATPSFTRTVTPSVTPTFSVTRSPTPTRSPTRTASPTPTPRMGLTKTVSRSVATLGDTLTFCLAWSNDSAGSVTMRIWDSLPSGFSYAGCDNGCLGSSPVSWSFAASPGSSGSVCFWGWVSGYP